MADNNSMQAGSLIALELGEELDKALKNLEAYAESRDKREHLSATRQLLSEASGVLNLTGQRGLATLAEDMSNLLSEHLQRPEDNAEEVLNVMADGLLGLNGAITSGRYSRVKLIGQLNAIRVLAGVQLASETELFPVDMDKGLAVFARGEPRLDSAALRKLHGLYQKILPGMLSGEGDVETWGRAQQVYKALHQLSGKPVPAAIGYLALLLSRAHQVRGLTEDVVLSSQLTRLGNYLGQLAENREAEDRGLLKNLLFCVLQLRETSESAEKVIRVFGLEPLVAELKEDVQPGFDQRLVGQVADELQEELNQTKLWLDDAVNGVGDFPQTVRQINTVFTRIADTMVMLGVTSMREAIGDLHERLQRWQGFDSIASVPADELQWFADHLVDLEEEVGHLSRAGTSAESRQSNEFTAAQKVIVEEGRRALAEVKEALNAYLSSTETGALSDSSSGLQGLEAALRFYPLPKIADMVRAAHRFIEEQIITAGSVPNDIQMNLLADILVAGDYYLECLEQGTAPNLDFLVERSLKDCAELGYPEGEAGERPRTEEREPAQQVPEAPDQEAGEKVEVPVADVDEVSAETGAAEFETTATESEPADERQPVDEEDEILAIFAEEAEEILPAARDHYAAWCAGSEADLADLRRAFHTLKGGGRMVGASVVGELSWAMENLLNHVMDGTLSAGQSVLQVVGEALEALPGLLEAMKAGRADEESQRVANLRETADRLANPSAMRSELAESQRQAREASQPEVSSPEYEPPVALDEAMPQDAGPEPQSEADEQEPRESAVPDSMEVEVPPGEPEPDSLASITTLEEQAASSGNPGLGAATRVLRQVYAHLEFSGMPVSDALASLVTRLVEQVASDPEGQEQLQDIAGKADELLAELERELVAAADGDRSKRYRPLQRLLYDDLDSLLSLESNLKLWGAGSVDSTQLDNVVADLELLEAGADRAQIEPIGQLASLVKSYLEHLPTGDPIDQSSAALLQRAYDNLVSMLDSIASTERVADIPNDLAEDLARVPQNQPPQQSWEEPPSETPEPEWEMPETATESEATAEPESYAPAEMAAEEDFDRELLDTFIEEADDLQAEVGEALNAWQAAPDEFEHADGIHRSLHTLKGGARLAGLEQLGTMSHEFESLIIDRQVMRSVDDAFFIESFRQYDQIVGEIERIKGILASGGNLAQLSVSVGSTTGDDNRFVQVTPLGEAKKAVEPVLSESTPEETDDSSQAAPKERREQFRIDADLLDRMVNLVGEAIVYRGRVEAKVSGFDTVLDELESTTSRIQSLSRRLDGETQAQIVFRREQIAEAGEEEEFDPLEMDRYSLLQQLSRQLIEAASDLQDLRVTLFESSREARALLLQNSRVQTELNDRLMDTRMVPFSRIVPRLQRMTRQIAAELEKNIRLEVGVVEGEMDRQVLDQILSPLEHILRNAIDHGIEAEQDRAAAGKDAVGVISLDVKRDGAHMVLRISDDGGGVDVDRVRQKAIENGLVSGDKAETMDEKALLDLIFAPGFSTARELTQISGRGVGMDVVRSKVRQLGGSIEIESESGKGTTFKLYLPFTLSVNRALMVRIADDIYALPLSSLEALVRISKEELAKYYEDPERRLAYGSNKYRYGYLGEFLYTLSKPELDSIDDNSIPLVLFRSGEHAMAIQVDEILGSQEVVVKSLGRPLHDIPGLAGAAIMGDGSVVVTLDMFTLLQSYDRRHAGIDEDEADRVAQPEVESRMPRIMIVDDSVTVRKVSSRFLMREGFLVDAARDGVEALRMVHEQRPDLMLLDLEMPRMDGFELLGALRSNERFADLPVFIITSRTGEKHRERGLELGAQRYFGKPYREEDILDAITEELNLDGRRKFKP